MSEKSKRQSKQSARRQQARKKQKRQQMINLGLIVLGAILVVGVLVYPSLKPVTDLVMPEGYDHPLADFNAMGDPNAPVVIEEYADFQCSHCANFFNEKEKLIIENYIATGQVYYIFNSYGSYFGVESGRSAEAAYCAGDQGKFWEMHDIIFSNFSAGNSGGYSNRRLEVMAENIGLDLDAYNDCMSSGQYEDLVSQDYIDAQNAGIEGTPSFLINGELRLQGNESFDAFQREIENALSAAGN